jgi:integrase/recombinase XerD
MYPNYLPLDPEEISAFLARFRDQGTCRCKFQHLHTFYRFLGKRSNGGVPNPMVEMIAPAKPRRVKKTLTEDQIRALFNLPLTDREFCIFGLFLSNGLRRGELLSLNAEDIGDRTITVRGKTGAKIFPLQSELLRTRLRRLASSGPVFCSSPGERMSKQTLERVIRATFAQIGVDGVTPHMFRHTFATLSLRNGMDSLTLQRMLGHTTLDMTREYVHQVQGDLLAAQDLCTPFALLEKERAHALPAGAE